MYSYDRVNIIHMVHLIVVTWTRVFCDMYTRNPEGQLGAVVIQYNDLAGASIHCI